MNVPTIRLVAAGILGAVLAVAQPRTRDGDPGDLVIVGARVFTVDEARPDAQAAAVRGERIVRVGSDADERP